jgi:hypothetical protein
MGYVYSYQDGDLINLCYFVDGQREGETITIDVTHPYWSKILIDHFKHKMYLTDHLRMMKLDSDWS